MVTGVQTCALPISTYPEGIDTEVFTFQALERAWKEAKLPSHREHVTPYIWNSPELFSLKNVKHGIDLSHLRWTLDYPVDLEFAIEVYKRLYAPGKVFLMEDILSLLAKEPGLSLINSHIERNTGYKKSLLEDTLQ
jgi:spore coat polysaccharide biosynthesis protein SpsF